MTSHPVSRKLANGLGLSVQVSISGASGSVWFAFCGPFSALIELEYQVEPKFEDCEAA